MRVVDANNNTGDRSETKGTAILPDMQLGERSEISGNSAIYNKIAGYHLHLFRPACFLQMVFRRKFFEKTTLSTSKFVIFLNLNNLTIQVDKNSNKQNHLLCILQQVCPSYQFWKNSRFFFEELFFSRKRIFRLKNFIVSVKFYGKFDIIWS